MLLSFGICLIILTLRSWVARFSGRLSDMQAVQRTHTQLTPRVGGLAIFGTLAGSLVFAPVDIVAPYRDFVVATALLFGIGLLEDLGYHVSARNRLIAAIASSLLVIVLLEVWLPRVGIPGLDTMMSHWAVGVPLTVLVTAGVTHGFNLIDGVHGLAGLAGISAAFALSQVAEQAGYVTMVHLALMVAAGTLGFLLLNFPLGLIFLGDSGAYTLGFVLSWFGVSVLLYSPEVSPWALVLILFWPIADTLLAIYRRARRRESISAPDRLHMHQLVLRALEICVVGPRRRWLANPLTTVLLSPFVIIPPFTGVILWDDNSLAFLAVLGFCLCIFLVHSMAPAVIRRVGRRYCTR